MDGKPSNGQDSHTHDLADVIRSEKAYIEDRRKKNDLPSLSDDASLTGICFSGGGIRSATLCLGIMQSFIKGRIFRRFDYLSTVSGGGYIGSCLTSLLSPDKPDEAQEVVGVDPENSPFVGLNESAEYAGKDDTKLNVRHQMHHLRTHGEYIVPRKGILSRDFQRAVGTLFAGILHHLVLYTLLLFALVSLIHFILLAITEYPSDTGDRLGRSASKPDSILTATPFLRELNYSENSYYKITQKTLDCLKADGFSDSALAQLVYLQDRGFFRGKDDFVATVRGVLPGLASNDYDSILMYAGDVEDSRVDYVVNELKTWAYARIGEPLYHMLYGGFSEKKTAYLFFFIGGVVWCSIFFLRLRSVRNRIYDPKSHAFEQAKSGFNVEDHFESRYIFIFNWASVVVPAVATLAYGVYHSSRSGNNNYLAVLFLPLAFALGGGLASVVLGTWSKSILPEWDRVRRSLFNAIQGAAFYGVVLAALVPVGLVLLFSLSYFKLKFWWSLVSLLASYFVLQKKFDPKTKTSKVMNVLKKPILTLLLLLFVALTFDWVSAFLLTSVYPKFTLVWSPAAFAINGAPLIIFAGAVVVFSLLGTMVNSNRISPHYFYRDRLTEAYLKTDARITRSDPHQRQGMPLVSVRNSENLRLADLGKNNHRAPYHIIVAALNLQGSDELNRKTMLSEHFIFTKNYIGSRVTGYVPTDRYRGGETKLARAMTISAAAAGSAMGYHSFWAQAFATTLFNVRLGYWMANPWLYCKSDRNPEQGMTFWPWWLGKELLGRFTARGRIVNLSDGGHTGDNLGLLPLLQRRCRVIVVCDGEADPEYGFESFNNAVRMAFIEENIEIDIDLTAIVPEKNKDGSSQLSKKSVAEGKISYPKTADQDPSEGRLLYLKASINEPAQEVPVHINNYHKNHPDFPHQSTGDQFFDDAQFEAYRALGEHLGKQALAEFETLKGWQRDA